MSKNALTIEQLKLACRHVLELIEAGMSENLAIRSLEIYANSYAKYRVLGKVTPDHADQYDYWSRATRRAKLANPNQPYGHYLRVEHGTPRRHFARVVLDAFKKQKLTRVWMNRLCDKCWKVAVITHAEDKRLSDAGRSTLLETPEARWAAAKTKF